MDPHSSASTNIGQPPPPPLPPPTMMVSQRAGGKDPSLRHDHRHHHPPHRSDRIQRSLESMTARHSREDVQQLVFRYLQQTGYLRSAMSFAYECMMLSGQQQRRSSSGSSSSSSSSSWSTQVQRSHPNNNNNTTDPMYGRYHNHRRHPFLPSVGGPSFVQLMREQQQEMMMMEAMGRENSSDYNNMNNDNKEDTGLWKKSCNQIMAAGEGNYPPEAADLLELPNDPTESSSSSLLATAQFKHPTRHQAQRSSPFGTLLLILVIYTLLRLGSMK